MKNDKNNLSKRTANQVKAILKSNGINFGVVNLGDGNYFSISAKNEIKNRFTLKQAGFILEIGCITDLSIIIKCH